MRIVLVEDDLIARGDELAHRRQRLMYINDLENHQESTLGARGRSHFSMLLAKVHHHAATCHLVLETNFV